MRLFVTSVLAEEPWKYDPKVIPLPWRQPEADAIKTKLSSGGLTLGYYDCDGVVLPHPPILRGVDTVVSTLKAAGHNVFQWTPYKHDYAVKIISGSNQPFYLSLLSDFAVLNSSKSVLSSRFLPPICREHNTNNL